MNNVHLLVADRFYWDTLDPVIVSEGMFAVANVFSFCRLFYVLAANDTLGPLQISLQRMISVSQQKSSCGQLLFIL